MFEELSVTEEIINKELKEQASSYFFLTTIHRTLAKRYELLEARKKKLWAQLYTKYKSEVNELTKRPNSDDSAKYMVEDNSKYYKLVKKTILVKNQMEILASAVKAFEQRKDTIQSLSANLRKEQ
jgi:TRAP-type mannitol/chloroaromatic compound transport system substrate-binding protein